MTKTKPLLAAAATILKNSIISKAVTIRARATWATWIAWISSSSRFGRWCYYILGFVSTTKRWGALTLMLRTAVCVTSTVQSWTTITCTLPYWGCRCWLLADYCAGTCCLLGLRLLSYSWLDVCNGDSSHLALNQMHVLETWMTTSTSSVNNTIWSIIHVPTVVLILFGHFWFDMFPCIISWVVMPSRPVESTAGPNVGNSILFFCVISVN